MSNTKTVGRLENWDAADIGAQTSFITLEEGSNIVRIVSSPYQSYSHWTTDATNQTRKVTCCMKDCPCCERGEQSKPRWFFAVLSRKTGTIGILEVGSQIFKQIRELSKKTKWGDPRGYDLDLQKMPKGSQPLYVVCPEPREALTDQEKTLVRTAMEKLDLQKLTEAPTPTAVCEKLGIAQKACLASAEDEVPADNEDGFDFNFDSK